MTRQTKCRTYDMSEAARLAGLSQDEAGDENRRTGALAGVPMIPIGRRILEPRAAFDQVLAGEQDNHLLTFWAGVHVRIPWVWMKFLVTVVIVVMYSQIVPETPEAIILACESLPFSR